MKTCKKCGQLYSAERCPPCLARYKAAWAQSHKQQMRQYRKKWRDSNPEKARASSAAWEETHKDEVAKRKRLWAEAHRDRMSAATSRYADRHPERVAVAQARWYVKNLAVFRLHAHNRRARLRAVGGKLSKGLADRLYASQDGLCVCCGKPLNGVYHMDHIMPLALGGANEDWNIQLLLPRCNLQKRALHPAVFLQKRKGAQYDSIR